MPGKVVYVTHGDPCRMGEIAYKEVSRFIVDIDKAS
jgi:hypothetical protein